MRGANRLLPVVLSKPQIEADRQDDQGGQHARDEQEAGSDLLLEQGRSIEGGRRESKDEPEDADLGGGKKQVEDPFDVGERAVTRWLGDDFGPEEKPERRQGELRELTSPARRGRRPEDRRDVRQQQGAVEENEGEDWSQP